MRRDAVDGVASNARQVCHANVFAARFVNQRKPPNELIVIAIAAPEIFEEAAVDLIDNFNMTGEQLGEQRQRPSLQCFS
jgi:hypothetical protein